MPRSESKTISVSHSGDVVTARRLARSMAAEIGFSDQAAEEIGLVASELAANLIRHAREGQLSLERLAAGGRVGLQVEAVDSGPGIENVDLAMMDGFSTAGGLGIGLGTANRLMDELSVDTKRRKGTQVVGRRWLRKPAAPTEHCPLEFGVATRPHPQMEVNGDAFVVQKWEQSALVAVIDGLGHGQFAHRAAQAARQYVATHFDRPLAEIFRGVGYSCRATRGVVMALARFDWALRQLTLASVGNVEVRVCGNSRPVRFISRRGVVGGQAPTPLITECGWEAQELLVLHTDGLKSHWAWQGFGHLRDQSATSIAQELLRALARDNDDATVVVVKEHA